jgi:hypothetical protein
VKRPSLFAVIFLLFLPTAVPALGVYEDVYDLSQIFSSPLDRSITGSVLRAQRSDYDASGFMFSADYPVKSSILVRAEMSYSALSTSAGIESGFGDLRFRARATLLDRNRFHLFATGALRTGSGSNAIFPYSTGSLDVQAGIACIDSLSRLSVWSELAAVRVSNKPGGLTEAEDHGDYAALSVGLVLSLGDLLSFHFGGSAFAFQAGGARELYFTGVDYHHSPALRFFISLQAEGGPSDKRAVDRSARAGIRVSY